MHTVWIGSIYSKPIRQSNKEWNYRKIRYSKGSQVSAIYSSSYHLPESKGYISKGFHESDAKYFSATGSWRWGRRSYEQNKLEESIQLHYFQPEIERSVFILVQRKISFREKNWTVVTMSPVKLLQSFTRYLRLTLTLVSMQNSALQGKFFKSFSNFQS